MAITTKALQDFINATKTQLASITSQLAAINTRFTKDETMISSIQATLKIPPSTDPCAGVATITDSLSRPPPTSGAQAYNGMVLPALGATYTDPVFCKAVRRLSNIGAIGAATDLYAHCWGNANGTYIFHPNANVPYFRVVSAADGSVVGGDNNRPYGASGNRSDILWHPTNPDKYFYQNGSQLHEYTVSTTGDVVVHTFPATLESLGGSVNWCDKTGRWFVIRWGGFGHVYDRQLDVVYTGNVPPAQASGWFGMSPSGAHVLTARDVNDWHISYLINSGAQTVDTTGIKFWNLDGDHGVPVSGSDGKDYVIACDSTNTQGLYRIDVTINQNGRTEAQQTSDNGPPLLDNIGFTFGFHASHGPNRAGQDWVFISVEADGAGEDDFNAAPSGWVKFKQEIIAINYLTGALRRLAHHRSRSMYLSYEYFPRLSCAWDGSLVIWGSNMNDSTPLHYSDFYGIANPLTS